MKAFSLLVALMALSSLGGNGNGSMNLREKAIDTDRPNGWYYVTSGKQDSLSAEPIVSTKEFAAVELDSFQNEQNKEMVYLIVGRVFFCQNMGRCHRTVDRQAHRVCLQE